MKRQKSVGQHLVRNNTLLFYELVGLGAVATAMCQLQISEITWMSALADRNDVVNCRAERMWILEGLVHRLPAYPAYILGAQYYLTGLIERGPVSGGTV